MIGNKFEEEEKIIMSVGELPFPIDERIWLVVKVFVLFSLLLYLAFSILVIRQVQLMTRTVTGKLDHRIRVVSWVHFLLTAGIFLGALLFL